MKKSFQILPIGTIHTPYNQSVDVPIQSTLSDGVEGTIEIFTPYVDGLKDLDGFSHILLLFYFHRSEGYKLQVTPFLDDRLHGVFSTRAPRRPNMIGLSVVELVSLKDNILKIRNVDMIDGTPLIDIKPYVPVFDKIQDPGIGWLTGKINPNDRPKVDDRFVS